VLIAMETSKYIIVWLMVILNSTNMSAQNRSDTCADIRPAVYDYFRQEFDSVVYVIGSVFLMHSDSLSFKTNDYCYRQSNDYLKIYFKDRLLYEYSLVEGEVEGLGYCCYPFESSIAVQATFKNSKLHGLVSIHEKNGKVLEIMDFEDGIYKKHYFHYLVKNKRKLKRLSKNRSKNPLKNDELIIV
jgi:regulatory protein YycH of two-component signal transduction system YycFG